MMTISYLTEDENGNLIEVPVAPTPFDGDEPLVSSDDLRRLPEALSLASQRRESMDDDLHMPHTY